MYICIYTSVRPCAAIGETSSVFLGGIYDLYIGVTFQKNDIYIYIYHQTWGFVHQDFCYMYVYIYIYNGTSKIYIVLGGTPWIHTLRWHTTGLPSDWEAIR